MVNCYGCFSPAGPLTVPCRALIRAILGPSVRATTGTEAQVKKGSASGHVCRGRRCLPQIKDFFTSTSVQTRNCSPSPRIVIVQQEGFAAFPVARHVADVDLTTRRR